MYTLQILAGGSTSVHALAASSTTFGSGDGADVQLHGAGVRELHARIEQRDEGLTLLAGADVVVNGEVDGHDAHQDQDERISQKLQ